MGARVFCCFLSLFVPLIGSVSVGSGRIVYRLGMWWKVNLLLVVPVMEYIIAAIFQVWNLRRCGSSGLAGDVRQVFALGPIVLDGLRVFEGC